MNESKIELTERLRREGRWSEASKFKDDEIKRLRAEEGLNREDAKERAWELMAEEYPPLPLAETDTVTENVTMRVQGVGEIPSSWPDLPHNASLQSELNWVQANRLRVVEERSYGSTVVHLDRARSPAPSWSALSWLETSIRSYAKFVDVVARNVKEEQDEQSWVKHERMAIEEVEALMEEMYDQWAEELLANTPETIREKVRGLLEDWARRSGLTIPDKAKTDLAGHVCELVDKCVGILAPSAGGE
ncbi:MAG: hypothetical protein DWQ29_13060 [Planctomycetota bacterium]|nr:MAG: hypothetical protein DWQ29_13060 [Planctomycetota bacterium]